MKLKLKKYLYLINDISSLLLKKEMSNDHENLIKLRKVLIIVCVFLLISLALNICQFLT